jgi:hypothetical protein
MDTAASSQGSSTPRHETAIAAAVIMLVAILTRMSTYGHPDLYVDETFYFATGLETLHGAVPFVDVWDRKPPGHFLLFTLIAAISDWYVTYQLVATAFAAGTGFVIYRMARLFASRAGAMMGAVTYLMAICLFNGFGGQSAVFYNLFIALSASLVISSAHGIEGMRAFRMIALAMLLAGVAISIKTTALFEAVFFGLFAAVILARRSGFNRAALGRILVWAALGALPTLAFAAWYCAKGYWDAYWVAMVDSNLRKPVDADGLWQRAGVLAAILAPFALAALLGLRRIRGVQRAFFAGWIIAAIIGFISVPAFYLHYALPLLVPFCLIGAAFFEQRPFGVLLFGLIAIATIKFYNFTDFAGTRHAERAMDQLVGAVKASKDGGPLLIFDGPPLLYPLSGSKFPGPLPFPNHLHQLSERNVSQFDTLAEVKRLLALRPGVIVDRNTAPTNHVTTNLVRAYEHAHCRRVASVAIEKDTQLYVEVWGHCREDKAN